jgi:hypothetical protein
MSINPIAASGSRHCLPGDDAQDAAIVSGGVRTALFGPIPVGGKSKD